MSNQSLPRAKYVNASARRSSFAAIETPLGDAGLGRWRRFWLPTGPRTTAVSWSLHRVLLKEPRKHTPASAVGQDFRDTLKPDDPCSMAHAERAIYLLYQCLRALVSLGRRGRGVEQVPAEDQPVLRFRHPRFEWLFESFLPVPKVERMAAKHDAPPNSRCNTVTHYCHPFFPRHVARPGEHGERGWHAQDAAARDFGFNELLARLL